MISQALLGLEAYFRQGPLLLCPCTSWGRGWWSGALLSAQQGQQSTQTRFHCNQPHLILLAAP